MFYVNYVWGVRVDHSVEPSYLNPLTAHQLVHIDKWPPVCFLSSYTACVWIRMYNTGGLKFNPSTNPELSVAQVNPNEQTLCVSY